MDFDLGIQFCRELKLNDPVDQLLHLNSDTNPRDAGVQQGPIASPILEDPAGLPQPVLVSSRSINSNPIRAPAMAGPSFSKGLPESDSSVDAANPKEGIFSEECALSIDIDAVRPHTSVRKVRKESNDAVSLRQSNTEAEKNHPQYTEGNPSRESPSYYSYRDFESSGSQLQDLKLQLQTPSKASSRYGSALALSRDLGFDVDDLDV